MYIYLFQMETDKRSCDTYHRQYSMTDLQKTCRYIISNPRVNETIQVSSPLRFRVFRDYGRKKLLINVRQIVRCKDVNCNEQIVKVANQ